MDLGEERRKASELIEQTFEKKELLNPVACLDGNHRRSHLSYPDAIIRKGNNPFYYLRELPSGVFICCYTCAFNQAVSFLYSDFQDFIHFLERAIKVPLSEKKEIEYTEEKHA